MYSSTLSGWELHVYYTNVVSILTIHCTCIIELLYVSIYYSEPCDKLTNDM